ncbi:bidirectional sugar transporter SWEET7-like [Mangifera indica]|uniref:bidirectional sugar transporter SWEET7-like n=1 Tax=Mangifera indica TaxID=29780 RepID=UPI001CF998E2|nr:bidirectional sugar transporter SWEET7-like [Mangifera indica]
MVSAVVNTVRNAVGIIGNIISLFLFLSPVPTFIQIVKKGSVEQYSPVPYLATLINCMVWVLYGLPMVHPNSILVITINGAGTAIELLYITLFLIYSDKKKRIKVLLGILVELIFIAIVAILVLTLLHTTKQRSLVVGIVCILFNIMMYASPLSVMKLVITTKSVEYMPFFLSFASFANGVAWTTYAFLPFDQFIAIPNGLGTLFSLVQLILYACFYKSTQRIIAERKAKGAEIGLSDVVVGNSIQNGHASGIHGGV